MDVPEISIVIPTFNRVSRLRTCLDALTHQTQTSADFEVIVVVDGSTDSTMVMLKKFAAPFRLRSIWQENSGQNSACNRGVAEATGRYCLFLDDDIVAAPRLITEHLAAQRAGSKVIAIGQIHIELPASASWYARAFAAGWRTHYESLNKGATLPTWEDCYGGNLSVPREMVIACGGFATGYARGFDVEFAFRLSNAGGTFVYVPEAVGVQDERKDFVQLSRDAENTGISDVIFYMQDRSMVSQALTSFSVGGWRKLLLRRLLLALRIPPRWLAVVGALLRSAQRQRSWHAFIQNLCYWRGARKAAAGTGLWPPITTGTPILMYHAIGADEASSTFVIPRERFAAHLAWIRRLGYRLISLDELLTCLCERRFPPARSVVITFDDGYADNYTEGFPIFRRAGLPATVFLVTRRVGGVNDWTKTGDLADRPLLSWDQAREMAERDVRFGAHSQSHPDLTTVAEHEADVEIAGSRDDIERELRRPVGAFAYPFGLHNSDVQARVHQAGYAAGCTVDPGLNCLATPTAALHRAEMRGTDSVFRLCLALWLGDADAFWPRKMSR